MSDTYETVEILNNACESLDKVGQHSMETGDRIDAIATRIGEIIDEIDAIRNEVFGWKDHKNEAVASTYSAADAASFKAGNVHQELKTTLRDTDGSRKLLRIAEVIAFQMSAEERHTKKYLGYDTIGFRKTLQIAANMGRRAQDNVVEAARQTTHRCNLVSNTKQAIAEYCENNL